MSTAGERLLLEIADRIGDTVENIEGIAEWAGDEGYHAIQHKIEEGVGRIESAAVAARQYADGTLEVKR